MLLRHPAVSSQARFLQLSRVQSTFLEGGGPLSRTAAGNRAYEEH